MVMMTMGIFSACCVRHYAKYFIYMTSLVVQWLRIHLPMQGAWVQTLVWEDPTCHGATKTVCHNY